MSQNIKELYGHKLTASDGEIGRVKDFYFDDKSWVIRYLVVDTGSWLTGRQVLISPHAFGRVDEQEKTLAVHLTRKQIEGSPSIEEHKPVSRQHEIEFYQYYGWPTYWTGGALQGLGGTPLEVPNPMAAMEAREKHHHRDDKHLQSTRAVKGYAVHATDGEIGSVSGFVVDDNSWAIERISVDSGHWFYGREILVPTTSIKQISYDDSAVFVDLTKAAIRQTEEHGVVKTGR